MNASEFIFIFILCATVVLPAGGWWIIRKQRAANVAAWKRKQRDLYESAITPADSEWQIDLQQGVHPDPLESGSRHSFPIATWVMACTGFGAWIALALLLLLASSHNHGGASGGIAEFAILMFLAAGSLSLLGALVGIFTSTKGSTDSPMHGLCAGANYLAVASLVAIMLIQFFGKSLR